MLSSSLACQAPAVELEHDLAQDRFSSACQGCNLPFELQYGLSMQLILLFCLEFLFCRMMHPCGGSSIWSLSCVHPTSDLCWPFGNHWSTFLFSRPLRIGCHLKIFCISSSSIYKMKFALLEVWLLFFLLFLFRCVLFPTSCGIELN